MGQLSRGRILKMKLTRRQLRKLIMEQLRPDQLQKLSGYLYSDNETDLRQGLALVQSFIDEEGMYPGVTQLYNEVAAAKNAKIEQVRDELRNLAQQDADIANKTRRILKQIDIYRDSFIIGNDPSTGRSMLKQIAGVDTPQDKLNAMKREFTHLMHRGFDSRKALEAKQAELQKLLNNYRIFEEFPINLDCGGRGSVVIQDPIME
jgi:hypothetical protein